MRRSKSLWTAEEIPAPRLAPGLKWVSLDTVPATWDGKPTGLPESVTVAAFGFQDTGGRWICSAACIVADGELTTQLWRDVPIGLLKDQAIEAGILMSRRPAKIPTSRPRRGLRPDMSFYRDVAQLYRQAVKEHPRRPVTWMAEQLDVKGEDPIEVTRRWVRTARRFGYLRGSIAGKPGEAGAAAKKKRRGGRQ